MPIFTIARLTLHEAARRKLVLAAVLLTIVVAALTGWAFHKLVAAACAGTSCSATNLKILEATNLILLAFMFSFVLAVAGAFLAAPAIAVDVESGVLLSILPRPIRRSDVLLGKWLGLATLLTAYAVGACGLEFIVAKIAMGYVAPHPFAAIAYIVAGGLVVLSVAMAGSTRFATMTVGIVSIILYGLVWIAGIAGQAGTYFHNQTLENVGTITSLLLPTDGLWRGALYSMEPVAALVAAGETRTDAFLAASAPTLAYHVWTAAWLAAVLGIAVYSFNRREV